jgi:hypothetical protein
MPSRYREFDLSQVKTFAMERRTSKVSLGDMGRTVSPSGGVADFLDSLPRQLAGNVLREIVQAMQAARKRSRAIIFATGAHTIKTGLSPIVIDLMERGYISHLALNGAGVVHDLELARFGATSEDVAAELKEGRFGFAEEANAEINAISKRAAQSGQGYGETVGEVLQAAPNAKISIFANAYRLRIPATVHVAIGTDIHTMRADADGAALGAASLRDFRILIESMRRLNGGGVLMNVGSAVILPEVILKAMSVLRNAAELADFTTFNMDFIRPYRSTMQVVERVAGLGGRGLAITGHNEIMLPLLAWALAATDGD